MFWDRHDRHRKLSIDIAHAVVFRYDNNNIVTKHKIIESDFITDRNNYLLLVNMQLDSFLLA